MRRHAAGVAVVTTYAGGPTGFTATSLTSVSLDPPLVSFAVGLTSRSWSAWRANQHGIIHLLDEGQAGVARMFAQSGEEKFGGAVPWRWTTDRLPLLDGVMAWMVAEPRTRVIAGDHAIILCHVVATHLDADRRPLVLYDGAVRPMAPPGVPS